MDKFDQVVTYAEELLEATRTHPERLLDSASSTSKWKTIYQKLLDLYLEENKKEPKCPKLKCTSHLLDKLVQREHLNTLVINLYPGNEGYSLLLKGRSGTDSETMRLPYEESELLNYIDAEQLPPLLVDILDKVQTNMFYCGCVIAEVHDYRRSINNMYDTQYVLLKPTPQTLLCDINAMTSGSLKWTVEDKLNLESQLLLHISEPLCLDPSPAVCLISNKFNYQKHKLNQHSLKRAVHKYSQTSMNKKQKLAESAAPKHLKLYDFLNKRKDKLKHAPPVNLKVGKSCVDMWRQREVHLTMPENIEVEKYAKLKEKPEMINDSTPVVVEEYTFETERSHGKVYYSKVTIMQRMNDEFYLGELYVDRDYVEGKSQGSKCNFQLGTKANVEKYIRQFREIFTEEGRRQVKISHLVPGQRPVVSYTQTVHAATTSQAAVTSQHSNIITQTSNLAATITGQLGIGISGTDSTGKKATPIRLSLSLNPQPVSGSTANTQVTPVTAQLTLNLQQQQQLAAAQRIRQMNICQGLQRPASSGGSQASTPTTPIASSQQSTGLPSATPPPNVNIANITSAPPNINIQNITGLQGVNIATNLQGLQNIQNVQTTSGASVPTLVTMVTAAQSSATAPTVTSASGSNSSGVLQLPLGVTGNLTQLMAGIKSAQGIRPGTPLLLSQIAGHPGQQVQLLSAASLSQARSQTVTHTSQTATLSLSVSSPSSTGTAQSVGTQPTTMSTLTQLQATTGQPQVLTTQQLVQLTSQQQLTQLALQQQKLQGQQQQKLTLQQLQQPQKLSQHQQLQILQQVQQQQKLNSGQVQQLRQQQSGIILTTTTPTLSENKSKKKKSLASSPKSS